MSLLLSILAPCLTYCADDITPPQDTPPAYQLVYKFQAGQSVHYDVTQSTTRRSMQATQAQLIHDRVHEKKHILVVEVGDDGTFVLKTVFDRVQMTADFGAKKVQFDSDLPASQDPPGFTHFRESISHPGFHVRFAPNGRLIAVRRLATSGPAAARAAGKNNDGSSFLVVFPERALHIDDSWREEYHVTLPLTSTMKRKIEILRTYRLRAVKDGIATITYASSFKTPVRNPEILARLLQSTPSGTIEFDIDAGHIVSRTSRVDETVLNPNGPQSMLHTVSSRVEKRVLHAPQQQTAQTD